MFTGRLLDAMSGTKNVVECAFVENHSAHPSVQFFSSPVRLFISFRNNVLMHTEIQIRLGPNGVEEILPMPSLSPYEQEAFNKMIPDLASQAKKGFEFVK
jgi:malate/lactate dehydrogenase